MSHPLPHHQARKLCFAFIRKYSPAWKTSNIPSSEILKQTMYCRRVVYYKQLWSGMYDRIFSSGFVAPGSQKRSWLRIRVNPDSSKPGAKVTSFHTNRCGRFAFNGNRKIQKGNFYLSCCVAHDGEWGFYFIQFVRSNSVKFDTFFTKLTGQR